MVKMSKSHSMVLKITADNNTLHWVLMDWLELMGDRQWDRLRVRIETLKKRLEDQQKEKKTTSVSIVKKANLRHSSNVFLHIKC